MSYDIQIWSVHPVSQPITVSEQRIWTQYGHSWVLEDKNWQIVVGHSDKILPEDVPEEVAGLLPGIQFLTEVNLEPIGAPKTAYALLHKVVKNLAKVAYGVVVDQQIDSVETPSGVKRFVPAKRTGRFSLLKLSWWFLDGPLLQPSGIDEFVRCLEKLLPEAMPRRYGGYEPPQYVFAETGRDHFVKFLCDETRNLLVWYPQRPVAGVHIGCFKVYGATRQGFRTNHASMSIEASTLDQPGWREQIQTFWHAATRIVRPFYGEARISDGYIARGGTYAIDGETEKTDEPRGPWWAGVPKSLGQAAVIGEPYFSLWPEFVKAANLADGLAFLSTSDWRLRQEVSSSIAGVPKAISQKGRRAQFLNQLLNLDRQEYPEVWPFGETCNPNR